MLTTLNTFNKRKSTATTIIISALRTVFQVQSRDIHASSKSKRPKPLTDDELNEGCRLGLDSHADMTCIGRHAHILEEYHGKVCNVFPFNDSYEPLKGIRTVNAAFAYDTEEGETYIIEVNQCLDFSDTMEHSLLCTNQARMNGIVVDDCPRALDATGRSTHSIYFPHEDVRLPLLTKFPISFLPVRYPQQAELDSCPTLTLTSADKWDTSLFDDVDRGVSSLSEYALTQETFATILSRTCMSYAIRMQSFTLLGDTL